jgi:hypothetical protein
MTTDVEDKVLKYYELNATVEDLEQSLKDNPAYRLISLVKTHGKEKDELSDITIKQYRKVLGKDPPAHVVKHGKIRWERFLDQLNNLEHGRFTYDQELKDEIESLSRQRDQLNDLKEQRDYIRYELRRTLPAAEVEKIMAHAPVFPRSEMSRAIVTEIAGLKMTAKRNPSFYQIEDNDPATPHIRVRYSADARKLMNAAARGYKIDAAKMRGITIKPRKATGKAIQMEMVEPDEYVPDDMIEGVPASTPMLLHKRKTTRPTPRRTTPQPTTLGSMRR